VKPVPTAILHQSIATLRITSHPRSDAIADMLTLGFYFLLQPGEYAHTHTQCGIHPILAARRTPAHGPGPFVPPHLPLPRPGQRNLCLSRIYYSEKWRLRGIDRPGLLPRTGMRQQNQTFAPPSRRPHFSIVRIFLPGLATNIYVHVNFATSGYY
jgi:hypothetical protein